MHRHVRLRYTARGGGGQDVLRSAERREVVRVKVVLVMLEELEVLECLRGAKAFDRDGVLLAFLAVGVARAVPL